MTKIQSDVAREIATFLCAPIVVNGFDITAAPARRANSRVSSVESFSTTIISCAQRTLSTQASMFAASFLAAMTTDTGTDSLSLNPVYQ
jgi:hypothetical protein